MNIFDIYKKFDIPPNLQEHMIKVFGIVCFIEKHWLGESVEWQKIKKMALVHDLGNLVKYDFVSNKHFLGPKEEKNIKHWIDTQSKMIKIYSDDDNEATCKMLAEIGMDPDFIDTVYKKRFLNSEYIQKYSAWPLKILYYSDLRVLPLKIGSLEERLSDIKNRYSNFRIRPDFEIILNACRDIEKQISSNLDIDASEINDESVTILLDGSIEYLKKLYFPVNSNF